MTASDKTKRLVLFSMFTAIIVVLAFTPIGFINLGFIKATIIHIPVIIGAILLGPKAGAGLGFVFGLTSLINNTVNPSISSFTFSPFMPLPGSDKGSILALLVCFIPRILVGVFPWFVYKGMQALMKGRGKAVAIAVSGVAGSMTNTLLVMHLIFFLFKDAYAGVKGIGIEAVYAVIQGIIVVNGIPEAIVAGIITVAVCRPLMLLWKQSVPSAAEPSVS